MAASTFDAMSNAPDCQRTPEHLALPTAHVRLDVLHTPQTSGDRRRDDRGDRQYQRRAGERQISLPGRARQFQRRGVCVEDGGHTHEADDGRQQTRPLGRPFTGAGKPMPERRFDPVVRVVLLRVGRRADGVGATLRSGDQLEGTLGTAPPHPSGWFGCANTQLQVKM